MPSPFPGMDPFVEMQEWDDFHPNFVTEIQAQLTPLIEPKYFVRVERRVYMERTEAEVEEVQTAHQRIPDVAVIEAERDARLRQPQSQSIAMAAPEECIVPQGEERREYSLSIRGSQTHEIVTVLEVLSPTNKRPGADGRALYLQKRQETLDGLSHFVELDLLRRGRRLPIHPKTPLGRNYYALVSRRDRRPRADLYAWPLHQAMPTILIPLAKGDPDVPLDLQTAFSHVYQRTRYDLSINYAAPLVPPPTQEEQLWLRELLGRGA